MPAEIPGYFYDEDKKKYFKVEKSQTAPASVSWSVEGVKKRKAEDAARHEARRRAQLVRNHIKRNGLGRDAVASGLLARLTAGAGRADDGDLGAAAWAAGCVDKGHVAFAPGLARGARPANMACVFVGGEDCKTGLGVAYATLDEETLVGSYVATDDNDRITLDGGAAATLRTEMIRCPQMSSIKYHEPSHRMLLTSREPDHSCGLYSFSPPLSDADADDARPRWLLGETDHYQRLSIRHRLRDSWLVHGCTPAPASSDLVCLMGTNEGVLGVRANETMAWMAGGPRKGPGEVFDQDFQVGNHNVVVAGGRQPRLWMADLRTPAAEWMWVPHASAVARVRSVNPYQVLVAGLESSMALYDTRCVGARRRGGGGGPGPGPGPGAGRPLLGFPAHRNAAHLHAGWDVSAALNVVAAAQDDGTVALFSLRSGRRLRCGDGAGGDGAGGLAGVRAATPLRALAFARLPGERAPSLFAGEGACLRKFSFGTRHLEEEA